jgi:hypothetical protein
MENECRVLADAPIMLLEEMTGKVLYLLSPSKVMKG